MTDVEEKAASSIDDVLPYVGILGRFQIILESIFCITTVSASFQALIVYYAAHNPPWRCASSSNICNLTGTYSVGDDHYKDRCSGMSRSDWEFTKPKSYSIITQFDLSCDTEYLIFIQTSLFFVGWAIGAIVLGLFSDRFGRKKVLYGSLSVGLLVSLVSSFSPNFWMFAVCRFIVGLAAPGTVLQMFVMASEIVGPKYRPATGILLWAFFTLAQVIMSLKAYLLENWRHLFLLCTAPYLPVLAGVFFVPESIRWLRVHGKDKEVIDVLKRIASWNKKTLPESFALTPLPRNTLEQRINPKYLFVPWGMAKYSLILGYSWLVLGMVYYGVTLAADDLGGSLYRDFILSSLVEFPAFIAAIVGCNIIGRKRTIIWTMIFGSIACIAVAAVPEDSGKSHWTALRITFGLLGKFGLTVAFDAIYTWSVELYPTVIRAEGMGWLQITSRVGAALAPWVAQGLKGVHLVLPYSIMGVLSFFGAISMLILPETKDRETMETLDAMKFESVSKQNILREMSEVPA